MTKDVSYPRALLIFAGLGACVIALSAASANAQTAPSAGQLLNDLNRSERESLRPTQTPDLLEEKIPRPAIKLPDGATVDVSRFRITGNTSFGNEVLELAVRPWEGRVLDVNGLNEAAGAVTRHYQSRGYLLAYAYLPVQKIVEGVIEIAVLEGKVAGVQIVTAQDVRLSDEVIQRYVEGVTQAPQVLQADLERRLLLLNDIPGVVARAAFAPGDKPGTADVIVTVTEEDPLAYSLEFNNHGSESTGEYRMGAQFHFKNLFGVGDGTRFRLQSSPRIELASGSINTRVPVGGEGWSLDASISRLTYELGEPYASLGARGEANSLRFGVNRQLSRSLNDNVSVYGSYDYKDLTDVLELISNNKKHSQLITLGLNLSGRDELGGGSVSQGTLAYSLGYLSWDTVNSNQSPAGRFGKMTYEASRRQFLSPLWSVTVRVSGQYAFDNLDSSEKFSLTGPAALRAYAPGQGSVDSGSVISLELNKAWPLSGSTLGASLFYDYARGDYNAQPTGAALNTVKLGGYGLGLKWANQADMDFSASAAWRDGQALSARADRKPYVYFQLTKGF